MLGGKPGVDPKLPKAWTKLRCSFCWKGQTTRVTVSKDAVTVENLSGTAPAELCGKERTLREALSVKR